MPQVEKLSIFLASPSDVRQERKLVRTVVEEINRTVAPDKGVVLDLVSSERAIPGVGKDGQAIINEQIGDMQQHDLFVGIMWNRIGTPTPRDVSGTAEEFARAVNALQRRKKPQVWFYFREANANLRTQDELNQKAGVLKFRKKLRGKGLFSEYTTLQSFEKKFREHLVTWLNTRVPKTSPASRGKTSRATSVSPKNDLTGPHSRRSPTTTTTEPTSSPARRKPAAKKPPTQRSGVAKSPGTWFMLADQFFQAKSTTIQADRSVVLCITPTTMEQIAGLRALQSGDSYRRKDATFANQHEAGITGVQSVVSETSQGKTLFIVTLAPLPQQNNNGILSEFSTTSYSADDIAELRARWIVLGHPLPRELEYLASSYQSRSTSSTTMTSSIRTLPQLWAVLGAEPRMFLPQAWLYAAYLLKTGGIVENIITFELGPIKDKKMRVTLRGRRPRRYTNHEPATINIQGECVLET